jgi:hypothetical protein
MSQGYVGLFCSPCRRRPFFALNQEIIKYIIHRKMSEPKLSGEDLLGMTYYHFCLPHGTMTKRYKCPTTPFMSADLPDYVWTMQELLEKTI